MSRLFAYIVCVLGILFFTNTFINISLADGDEHEYKKRHRDKKHFEHEDERELSLVENPTYAENCGACHYAYQPGLLPSNSWKKILDNLENHFGELVDIAPLATLEISEFLKANGANQSHAELSRKIMKSLGDQTPLRISQIPYIHKKHDDIPQSTFSRKSIRSLSNCSACHTTAEKGIYDDDDVTIPRQ